MMKYTLPLTALLFLGACNADHPIGQIDPDTGTDLATSEVASLAPDTAATGGVDAGAVATPGASQSWTGYIENYKFPSGSDAVRLTFSVDSAGQVTGKVIFGNGAPPPLAMDPSVGYYGDPQPFESPNWPVSPEIDSEFGLEGFSYSMIAGTLVPSRLRFAIQRNELWSGWCSLQTPILGTNSCFNPAWNGSSIQTVDSGQCSVTSLTTGEVWRVDCGRFNLCRSGMCVCSASHCTFDAYDAYTTTFDLALGAGNGSGSTVGRGGGHFFHFTKDP